MATSSSGISPKIHPHRKPSQVTKIGFTTSPRVLASASTSPSTRTAHFSPVQAGRQRGTKITRTSSSGISPKTHPHRKPSQVTKIGLVTSPWDGLVHVTFNDRTGLLTSRQCKRPLGQQRQVLWDLTQNPPAPQTLAGHQNWVYHVTFNEDGSLLASASSDNNVILWDLTQNPPAPQTLAGHQDSVRHVTFNEDGSLLASASEDGNVILWDLTQNPPAPQTLAGHQDSVRHVTFNEDGSLLASASWDNNVILWNIDPISWQQRACTMAGRNFTEAEWQRYLGDRPYEQTCFDDDGNLLLVTEEE